MFLRLAGCNLACRWPCDTPYSWDWTGVTGKRYDPRVESRRMHFTEVREAITQRFWDEAAKPAYMQDWLIVVTGGEPMLQRDALYGFFDDGWPDGPTFRVEVETNGTIPPPSRAERGGHDASGTNAAWVAYNVSPKLVNSGNDREQRIVPDAIEAFRDLHGTAFKFVVRDLADFDEIERDFVEPFRIPRAAVWIMPEGMTADDVLAHARAVADETIARGFNLTLRQHILIWGAARGR